LISNTHWLLSLVMAAASLPAISVITPLALLIKHW
jgi:hypothetical protein